MNREEIATGNTVDEAIEAACAKLGVLRENVEIDVIEMPKKKFFGLKNIPAKVKVTLNDEYAKKFADEEKKTEQKKPKEQKPVEKKPAASEAKPALQEQPKEKKQEKPKQKPQAPKKEEAPAVKEQEQPEEKNEEAPAKPLDPETVELKGGAAASYIKEILVALGYEDADVTYAQKDGMIVLQLTGENMGAVVGRRGDNLDAMQYLASLVANRSEGNYVRVVLDIDDYRSKREASLRAYARKTAISAARSHRAITLEAMNPYERRIVHSTVQTVSGVTSKSIGSEPNRRVVISPIEGAKYHREGGRPHGDMRHGQRGQRPPRRESQKVVIPESNEPPKNDTSAISLYGRIDLD